MAELTNLEAKLGEVTGLAMAAQAATKKVITLARDDGESELVDTLSRMHEEAVETEKRCTDLAGSFDGKKTAIIEEARQTKAKGAEMLTTYLDEDSDALDGVEFLTMAEAGEVGHWSVLDAMARPGTPAGMSDLVSWALPIQQRHFQDVMAAAASLAKDEDPNEPN